MTRPSLRTALVFGADDQAWMRLNKVAVPEFWAEHGVPPARGDVLRFGGRQFVIEARVWEHDADGPLLRLFAGDAHAPSDTVFG